MSVPRQGEGDGDERRWPGRRLAVNRADLLRGLVCVGKRQATTLLREPERRASEVRGLAGLLDAYVAFTDQGPETSAFYHELDSREKASFSYRFGIAVALLMAQRELGVPWLMHAQALLASGAAELEPEDASPTDLVGLSRGGHWSVVRARARSSELTDAIVEDALDDVEQLASVNDRPPTQRRACVTALGVSPFLVSFADPAQRSKAAGDADGGDGEGVRLRVDPSRYITEHYAQFSFLTSLETRRRELEEPGCGNLPPVVAASLEGTAYEIGLLEPLHAALLPPEQRSGDEGGLDEAVPSDGGWRPTDPRRAREAGVSVGRDGVVVTGPTPPDG